MRTRIVRIGNSHGIRIPKPLLDASGLEGEVELTVESGRLIVARVDDPRSGWEEAFAREPEAAFEQDFQAMANRFDRDEWRW